MYLKSLALKGFKSFADPTTLEFEPGVTVVVGPNGSGKSNVVDAIAWVLGAQGPRVVRSQKMDDVIFAGTAKRAAVGRAEVSLTIDNSSRRLPVDFNEVTITRTLFRSGESEYQLNGVVCRLLDVQELLSDSGVGRQQHVIVGQGQLDAVLAARPEDRRAVIEEAAGVLKFRRRRERAERRLESSEAALARLQDLLREVRRQLKPLERQASSALRHEEIAQQTDALRLYLTGQELRELATRLFALQGEMAALDDECAGHLEVLERIDADVASVQDELDRHRTAELGPSLARFAQLAERARGTAALISERRRARAELASLADDTDALVQMESELHALISDLSRVEQEAIAIAPRWDELAEAERQHAEAESEHVERFGITESTEANARLATERRLFDEHRDALSAAREARGRSGERSTLLSSRLEETTIELSTATAQLDAETALLSQLRDRHEAALAKATVAEATNERAKAAYRSAEEASYLATARVQTISDALDEARAKAGLDHLSGLEGIVGTLYDVVTVQEDFEAAFDVALGGLLDSVLVETGAHARAAIARLREGSGEGAVLALEHLVPYAATTSVSLGSSLSVLREHVRGTTPAVDRALDALLGGILVARRFDDALDHVLADLAATVVTTSGERLSPQGWRIGTRAAGATRAALDEARAAEDRANRALEHCRDELAQTTNEATRSRRVVEQLENERESVDRSIARRTGEVGALSKRVEQLRRDLASEQANAERLEAEVAEHAARATASQQVLSRLEQDEQDKSERRQKAVAARRQLEERARSLGAVRRELEVRAASLEARRTLLVSRKDELEREVARREEERARAHERRSTHESEDLTFVRLNSAAARVVARLESEHERLSVEQARRTSETNARLERLAASRRERDTLERALSALRERHQRCEIDETEARVRHEAAADRLRHELDVEPDAAIAAVCPELPDNVEPSARLRELERELRLMGPVNPLAKQELEALTERHGFLESQLEDVRSARRELHQVIHAIDTEIVDVFAHAYADVERHFSDLVATLFPGGSGRLELTAPDDLLNTGVEIEARPAGRNVRRLSLLSGGERSLVAIAFLFAVFRSRPSPFYVLDEVEAALDEVNLLRFLALVEEFRDEAQLIIVSHQKKTMETADALYGISMQPGGASKAVSESLRRVRETPNGVPASLLELDHPSDTVAPIPVGGIELGADER